MNRVMPAPDDAAAQVDAAYALYEALDAAPILSKYDGRWGFEIEKFIVDYAAWGVKCRAAIALARGETK